MKESTLLARDVKANANSRLLYTQTHQGRSKR